MKLIIVLVTFFFSIEAYSQSDQVASLKLEEEKLTERIDFLKDSLNKVQNAIASFNSKDVLNGIPKESFKSTAQKGSNLKNKPDLLGKRIFEIKTETNIIINDYINGYYAACINKNLCGYIHEMFVGKNENTQALKAGAEEKNRLLVEQEKLTKQKLKEEEERLQKRMVTTLSGIARVYKFPSNESLHLSNFDKNTIQVVGFRNGYFKVKSQKGQMGYVQKLDMEKETFFSHQMEKKAMERAKASKNGIFIRGASVSDINSAGGVSVELDWMYLDENKKIKYIEFTMLPYNNVGDVQKSEVGGHSLFTGQSTGPIEAVETFRNPQWSNGWYNNTITCIKITKVKVEYMDGTSYVYVKELPKIMDSETSNSCNY